MADEMPDETREELTDDLKELFEGWYQERVAEDRKRADRSKQPKDFGDFLDKVASAIWDEGEARAAKRRQAQEEADQPPDRGRGESKVSQWWGGSKAS